MKISALPVGLLAATFFASGTAHARGQALPAAIVRAIDAAAQASIRDRHVPSVVILISRHGKIVYAKARGYRNVTDHVPTTLDTRYQFGSLTKQFTAMGIFLLAQDGKLSLDDQISKYVPKFAGKGRIAISNLLSHTSGIANCTEPDNYPFAIAPRRDLGIDWCIDFGLNKPLDFPTGTKASYSNTGYVLLERIIEKVSGDSFAHFVTTRLLQPADMTTAMEFDANRMVPRMATGYAWFENRLAPAPFWDLTGIGGAGFLIGEAADLMRWDEALLAGKLLQPKWQKLYYSPGRLNNGRFAVAGVENPTSGASVYYLLGGTGVQHRGGKIVYGANGGTFGFTTFTGTFPATGITLTTLTNMGGDVDNGKLTVPIIDALLTLQP